jgi:hypothetical protein
VSAQVASTGRNVEVDSDASSIELESLGPRMRLGPRSSVGHDERWELRQVEQGIRSGLTRGRMAGHCAIGPERIP